MVNNQEHRQVVPQAHLSRQFRRHLREVSPGAALQATKVIEQLTSGEKLEAPLISVIHCSKPPTIEYSLNSAYSLLYRWDRRGAPVLKVLDVVCRSEADRTVHALGVRTRVWRTMSRLAGVLAMTALFVIALIVAFSPKPAPIATPPPEPLNPHHLPVVAVASPDRYLEDRFITALYQSHRFLIVDRFGRSLDQLHAGRGGMSVKYLIEVETRTDFDEPKLWAKITLTENGRSFPAQGVRAAANSEEESNALDQQLINMFRDLPDFIDTFSPAEKQSWQELDQNRPSSKLPEQISSIVSYVIHECRRNNPA